MQSPLPSRARVTHVLVFYFYLIMIGTTHAIIFYSTGDPSYNTSPPSGTLTNSGWQFQGQWGPYLGTAIAPQFFITAKHIQASVGDQFLFANQTYSTIAFYDDPETDLRICQVCGALPIIAPLYTGTNEVGAALVVFGRGTRRGNQVYVNSALKGWTWGISDLVERWGQNQVAAISNGGPGAGDLLQSSFDAGAGTNESTLSVGDSGGAVFIQDNDTWKLAAINYSVDGPFNTNDTGPGFEAAIFDQRELYVGGEGIWTLVTNSTAPVPATFYSTRISSRIDWITSILSQPLLSNSPPVLQSATAVTAPYADNTAAILDTSAQTITLPRPTQTTFFRLRACSPSQVTRIRPSATNLVINYQ